MTDEQSGIRDAMYGGDGDIEEFRRLRSRIQFGELADVIDALTRHLGQSLATIHINLCVEHGGPMTHDELLTRGVLDAEMTAADGVAALRTLRDTCKKLARAEADEARPRCAEFLAGMDVAREMADAVDELTRGDQ